MPDHVHFFCTPVRDCPTDLSQFIGKWKRWTCGRIRHLGLRGFNWQAEFFDHLIRGGESYEAKWRYVRENPVRARLVAHADEWAYQGEVKRLQW